MLQGRLVVIFSCIAVTLIQHLIHHYDSFINSHIPNFEQKCSFGESDVKGVLDLSNAHWLQ